MIGSMVGVGEEGGAREVGESATAWARVGERSSLGDGIRE